MSDTTFSNFIDQPMRDALHKTLALTIPPQHVDEVVDLACKAAVDALNVLQDTAFEAPVHHGVSLAATSIALSLLNARCIQLKQTFENVARSNGLPFYEATLQVQR